MQLLLLDDLRAGLIGQRQERKAKKKEENELPDYMFFDFRRGPDSFPSNCTIVDPMNAAEILEKQTSDILEKLKSKKKEAKLKATRH